jgi:dimethylaniline monooxygenase (N-oxide forming)
VNDDLPNRIASGAVVVKPNVRKITKTGVEFEDGSLVDNIDVIILATGFKFGFPFLEEGIIEVKNNKVDLYKNMFPPELSPPSLAAIGFFQPLGAIMPIAELQCRWATRVFKGTSALPPKDQMWEDIRAKHEAMASRYVESSRHTIQVDWIPFMDEIAEQVGCKPDLWKMLFRDPQLAISCFCGPCTPYQFRLQGPLPWKGARKAILTQWQRVEAPLKTRNVDDNADDSFTWWKIILAVIVLAILLKLIF